MLRLRVDRVALGLALAGSAFLAVFAAVASVSDFFVDRPFIYTTTDEWSNHLVRSRARFPNLEECALYIVSAGLLLPAIICFSAALTRCRFDPYAYVARGWQGRDGVTSAGLAVGATVAAVTVCLLVTRRVALLDDERAYLFESTLFAHGRLSLPTPPPAFRNPMFVLQPAWMSKYAPGQSLALLPGVLVGLPHAVPALLSGAAVYITYRFAAEAYGDRVAMLAAAMLAASPFLWCVGATLLSFVTTATAIVGSLWLSVRAEKRGGWRLWVAAGALLGFAAMVRPIDALALGLPLAVWAVRCSFAGSVSTIGSVPTRWAWLAFAVGATPWLVCLGAYNALTSGSPFRFTYAVAGDYSPGFFVQSFPGLPYEHTPVQSLAHLAVAINRLDIWLFGWPGSLLLTLAGACLARDRYDRLVLAMAGSFLVFYTLAPATGTWDVGPTYYFAIAPLLVVVTARGVQALRRRFVGRAEARLVGFFPLVGAAVAAVTTTPLHLYRLSELAHAIEAPTTAVAEAELGESIVALPRQMGAAGYALGYPYEVWSGSGTAHLVRPRSVQELHDARRWLGETLPVYQLVFDVEAFQRDMVRRYQLQRLVHAAESP